MTTVEQRFAEYVAGDRLRGQVEMTRVCELSEAERRNIPATWLQMGEAGGRAAVTLALNLWRTVLPTQIPEFLGVLDSHGWDIRLARLTLRRRPRAIVLIYIFAGPFREGFALRVGFPPTTRDRLPAVFASLPERLTRVYTELHDGFLADIVAEPAGLLPSNQVCPLDEMFDSGDFDYYSVDSSGYLINDSNDGTPNPTPPPDLSRLVEICRAMAGGRLLIDLDAGEMSAWEQWFGELEAWAQPLWARLDDWLIMPTLTGCSGR